MIRLSGASLVVFGLAAAAACETSLLEPAPDYPQQFVEVAAGDEHTCAISVDGYTYCWGNREKGRLGQDGRADVCDEVGCRSPLPIRDDPGFSQLAAGETHTCGIADGQAYCWGFNRFGQLGDDSLAVQRCPDDTPFTCSVDPLPVVLGLLVEQITVARYHSCALLDDGRAACWGWNIAGQLGRGNKDERPHPIAHIVRGDHRFTDIDTGYGHTCGVTEDDTALCWGAGDFARLGTGDRSERLAPAPVAGDEVFEQASAGGTFSCALAVDGEVTCWGWGLAGRLGTGDEEDRDRPTRALLPEPATFVSAGHGHACAIGRSGALYCWGGNDAGQLGLGDRESRLVPEEVALPGDVLQVSAGRWHTCAILADQRLYCWGGNYRRQLGDGTVHSRDAPVLINP